MTPTDHPEERPLLGAKPEFYLIYLAFYFVPWLFYAPDRIDVIVGVIAAGSFVPIYLFGFKHSLEHTHHQAVFAFICLLYAWATAPFNGAQGTYYIYAVVMAAFVRPHRQAYWLIALVICLYLPTRLLSNEPLLVTLFTIGLSLMIGIGSIATAAMEDRETSLTRSRDLDSHLAALGERERIARDLHDLLGHTLTMLAHKAELAEKLIDHDPTRSRQELKELGDEARNALGNVREAIRGMQMTTLSSELERAKVALRSADVVLEISGAAPTLDRDISQTLGLVIREAVTNIVRHSLASKSIIAFSQQDHWLSITVSDNGNGAIQRDGRGIAGLRRRVEALDGQLEISTIGGTSLAVRLPLERLNQDSL